MKYIFISISFLFLSCEKNSYDRIEETVNHLINIKTNDYMFNAIETLGYNINKENQSAYKLGHDSTRVILITCSETESYDNSALLEIAHFFSKINLNHSLMFNIYSDSISSLQNNLYSKKILTIIHINDIKNLNKKIGVEIKGVNTHASFKAIIKTLSSQVKYPITKTELNDVSIKSEIPTLLFSTSKNNNVSKKLKTKGIVSLSKFIARLISAIDNDESFR